MVGKYWSRYNCSASGHAHLSTAVSTVWICACRSTNDGLQKAAACSCSRPGGYGELAATPVILCPAKTLNKKRGGGFLVVMCTGTNSVHTHVCIESICCSRKINKPSDGHIHLSAERGPLCSLSEQRQTSHLWCVYTRPAGSGQITWGNNSNTWWSQEIFKCWGH